MSVKEAEPGSGMLPGPGRSAPLESRAPSGPGPIQEASIEEYRQCRRHSVDAEKRGRQTAPKFAKAARDWEVGGAGGTHRKIEAWLLSLGDKQLGEASAMLVHF